MTFINPAMTSKFDGLAKRASDLASLARRAAAPHDLARAAVEAPDWLDQLADDIEVCAEYFVDDLRAVLDEDRPRWLHAEVVRLRERLTAAEDAEKLAAERAARRPDRTSRAD